MNDKSSGARTLVVLGLLFLVFLLAQALALGARFAETSGTLFGLLQTIAILVALAVGWIVWWLSVSRVTARQFAAFRADGDSAWLVSTHRETKRAVELATSGGVRRLPSVFLIELRNGGVCFVAPPQQDPFFRVPSDQVRDVNVGRTYGMGGASECLVVTIRSSGSDIDLPLVLLREKPPHLFTQGGADLSRSRERFARELASEMPHRD
jgi:hypothetical protein